MIFTYRCEGHFVERDFPPGGAPDSVLCGAHGLNATRHYGPETLPQIGVDPFRQFDLSPRKERAQAEQQRYVEAPRDKVEARAIEAETGRRYVGDDTSGMSKAAQRGIDREKDRKSQQKKIIAVS